MNCVILVTVTTLLAMGEISSCSAVPKNEGFFQHCYFKKNTIMLKTRHKASTSSRWHFACSSVRMRRGTRNRQTHRHTEFTTQRVSIQIRITKTKPNPNPTLTLILTLTLLTLTLLTLLNPTIGRRMVLGGQLLPEHPYRRPWPLYISRRLRRLRLTRNV